MKERAPEDIRKMEQEAEHRQQEAESLVEAARERQPCPRCQGVPS
jgi:hypothetical protein